MERLSSFAPLSGLTAAILFAIGSGIWGFEQPARNAGTEEIVSFYEDTSTEILIGGTLSIVSVLFLIWFGAVLYERLSVAEGSRGSALPLMAFGGAVVLAAVGLGAETINIAGALRADDGELTPETAQIYFDVSYALGYPAAGVGIAALAAPTIVLRTGSMLWPWAASVALIVAIVLLPSAVPVLYGLGILLMAAFSVRLYREGPSPERRRGS